MMGVQVLDIDFSVLPMRARMPFRYGIATLTALPHLFVRVDLAIDGQRQLGTAAEGLPPKWFTKDPRTSFVEDLTAMLAVITHAAETAKELGVEPSVFALWRHLETAQRAWAALRGYPALLWSLGLSLVERATIDAYCRLTGAPFGDAVRKNTLGIDLGKFHPSLAGQQPSDLLPDQPLPATVVRHTVGLSDPLTDQEIPPADRLDDGLPQSLVACIDTYALTHFKIKVTGDVSKDMERLRRVAAVIAGRVDHPAFTLDGNEQFHNVGTFRHFWQALQAERGLGEFLQGLLFVEQPWHRAVALGPDVADELRAWAERPPIIIDESDAELDSLPAALRAGYAGTSHKNCKGIFKGVANACLLARRRSLDPNAPAILSGEDLANVGPVALLQDLAVMATLGVTHVERNGHHYFRGLSMYPAEVQEQVLSDHPDLYRRSDRGFVTLRIEAGQVGLDTVNAAPFGLQLEFDASRYTPLATWSVASLAVGAAERC